MYICDDEIYTRLEGSVGGSGIVWWGTYVYWVRERRMKYEVIDIDVSFL